MSNAEPIQIEQVRGDELSELIQKETLTAHHAHDLRWLKILQTGLGHSPILLEARRADRVVGRLPLATVNGPIFGKFLVGLPYLNTGGVAAADSDVESALINEAIKLTDEQHCRQLELRHEQPIEHPGFNGELTSKIHMRLILEENVEAQRAALKASVRNQVKKGEKQGFTVEWGQHELLKDFYKIFSRRMRDLGTPVYSRKFFSTILDEFPEAAEICVVRDGSKPIAVAILIHGTSITEVPSASALPEYNRRNANMYMYWNLITRAVERGQLVFDFGRSTIDGPTFKFKKQWKPEQLPATWQYYLREGNVEDMRPDSGKKKFLIKLWKLLPIWLANLIGPWIVKGIP